MNKQKRQYTQEFKQEAIRLYEASGRSVRQIEEELGISSGLLNKWRYQLRDRGRDSFVGSGHQPELESELKRLKRENEILRQERDILKKALVVFSKDG